jgi:hypothetical protein
MILSVPKDVFATINDNLVRVIGPDPEGYYEIDGIAADIWQAIPELKTRDSLIENFFESAEEEMTKEEFTEHINQFIDELLRCGLIVES